MVSVIIPNFDGAHFLGPCLRSLFAQGFKEDELDVLVIDNGSRDGSVELVQREFPSVRLIANAQNLGFTGATNQGLEAARGEWILLLNNDTVMDSGSLRILLDQLRQSGDEIGGVQPLLLWAGDRSIIDSTGIALSARLRARDNQQGFPTAEAPREVSDVWGICFGCALLRRDVFARCGFLDPVFFADWDDVDFCLRARWRGYKFRLVPQAKVLHHRSPTMKLMGDDRLFRLRRNQLLTYAKALPGPSGYWRLFYRLQRDVFMLPHYLKKRQMRLVWRLWKEVFRLLPGALRERRRIMKTATVPPRQMARELRLYMTAGWQTNDGGLPGKATY
jgi:hypothetical protein